MEVANNFQDLNMWQKSHQLVLEVYQISANFPKEGRYGLTSQLRRAVFLYRQILPKLRLNRLDIF